MRALDLLLGEAPPAIRCTGGAAATITIEAVYTNCGPSAVEPAGEHAKPAERCVALPVELW
jgi:hypothetical protein